MSNTNSVLSTQFFSKLASSDPGVQKQAAEAATDYTRITLRDEGILRKILPVESITEAQLDNQLNTDHPVKIVEKEVQTPLGASVPFSTLPSNVEMNFSKYSVNFARILTKNFIKDVQLLKGYNTDIRNIFKDAAIKDMMTAEDVPFMALIDAIITPQSTLVQATAAATALATPTEVAARIADTTGVYGNQVSKLTGKVQYYDWTHANGNPLGAALGFSRDSLVESKKILLKAHSLTNAGVSTPIRNKPALVLMNANTFSEYEKFTRDNMGGDKSQELFEKGVSEGTYNGLKHVTTLKDDIVLDGMAYYFAAPEFLGRAYELQSPTMFMELRAYLLEFFAYSCLGASIGNPYAVAAVRFFR